MRTVSSSFLAALIVMALFWGNCLSCPQMLLLLSSQAGSHACCHRTKAPVSKDCQSHRLQNFVKADASVVAASPAPVVIVDALPAASITAGIATHDIVFIPYSPPDRQALHSTFRI